MISLALAFVISCKPIDLTPFTVKGNTERGLSLSITLDGSRLLDASGELVWATSRFGFKVLFAADDSWVAFKGPYPVGGLVIVRTQKGALPVAVEPMSALSAAEQSRVPITSCGPSWFAGWKSTARGLALTVEQGGPQLTLYVSPSGALTR